MSLLGQSIPRIDARGKVTGETLYPGDIYLPDMLHMKLLFAGRPHARIRAIDTSSAEAMPGVVAILTAKDVPVNLYGLIRADQPVLCGPGSDVPGADVARFVGDRIAVIVAESEKAAAAARDQIRVDFEDLPVITDPRVSMQAPANGLPLLFPGTETNIVGRHRIRKGDMAVGFAEAEVIVEAEYQTAHQEHAYLQPEAGVSYVDDDGIVTVIVGGQWTHHDRWEIAQVLNLPEERIRVIYPATGGAFGGREDMSVQIVLALAAWRLAQRGVHRPIKIVWSREESITGHHKRHPMTIKAKWGARRDGKVVTAQMEIVADAGAYQSTSVDVLGIAAMNCTGPYEIPHISVDAFAVYTNNITSGAFRGFGGPQAALAAEGQMNKLAEELGLDPVEIRLRNVLTEGAISMVGTPFPPGISIGLAIEQCAEAAGWTKVNGQWQRPQLSQPTKEAPFMNNLGTVTASPSSLQRGIGFACGFKNVGFNCGFQETSTVKLELHGGAKIEKVVVYNAASDVGQGAHTMLIQLAAEALGVSPSIIELVASDTAVTEDAGPCSASRLAFMGAGAIQGAAKEALAKWQDEDRPAVATYTYLAPPTTPFDPETGYSSPNITYAYVAEAAEVEVDLETGHVRALRIICADDAGRVINRQMAEGQVEGAVVQGHGYATLENFIVEGGYIKTPHLSTYLIPTVLDIPETIKPVFLEVPDPYGAYGIRGIGEAGLIPVAAALCAAVKDATGVWIDQIPLTPPKVLSKLQAAGRSCRG